MEAITVTPTRISHNAFPVFHASWFSGEIKAPQDSHDSFYYKGSGGNDSILIYAIEWENHPPDQELFSKLMNEAITSIDNWISLRF